MEVIKSMKILIVGDSYATNYSEYSWTSLVEKHLNATVENHARPASSLNYSYLKLTASLSKDGYDVIIFVLTSADRLYHRDMLIHGGFPQYNDGTPVTGDIKKAVKSYYAHIYDSENTPIINNIFCRALGQISLDYPNTKFIFVPAFAEFEKINFGNCVVTSSRLLDYSLLDKERHDAEVRGEIVDSPNHLTFFQNQTLANYIIEIIDNYKFGQVTYQSLDKLKILK